MIVSFIYSLGMYDENNPNLDHIPLCPPSDPSTKNEPKFQMSKNPCFLQDTKCAPPTYNRKRNEVEVYQAMFRLGPVQYRCRRTNIIHRPENDNYIRLRACSALLESTESTPKRNNIQHITSSLRTTVHKMGLPIHGSAFLIWSKMPPPEPDKTRFDLGFSLAPVSGDKFTPVGRSKF